MAELTDKQKAEIFEQEWNKLRAAARELLGRLNSLTLLGALGSQGDRLAESVRKLTLLINEPHPAQPEPEATKNAAPQSDPEVLEMATKLYKNHLDEGRKGGWISGDLHLCWLELDGQFRAPWLSLARFVLAEQKELRERNAPLEEVREAAELMLIIRDQEKGETILPPEKRTGDVARWLRRALAACPGGKGWGRG